MMSVERYLDILYYGDQGIFRGCLKLILATSGDKPHDIIHGIPASRILRRFGTFDQLRARILVGFSAKDIVDPDVNFPELLQSSWDPWKSMDGKSEDEKRQIKQQIEHGLSIVNN